MTAQVMPLGYAIGKYLPADENGLRKRLDSYFDVLEKASVTKEILLPNGHDQDAIAAKYLRSDGETARNLSSTKVCDEPL